MIIECSVTNFKSLKEEQVLRFSTDSNSDYLKVNIHRSESRKFGVLRTCGIYGANASGKSNILEVFRAIRYMICFSGGLSEGASIPCYSPFKLDKSSSSQPTVFEIEFEVKDIQYIYLIEFDNHSIKKESLVFYPSTKKALLFEVTDGDWKNVKTGNSLKGGKKKYEFYENNSYLSTAGSSAGAPEIIRDVFKFFYRDIDFVGVDQNVYLKGWTQDKEMVSNVSEILCAIDTGIKGLSFEENDITRMKSFLPADLPDQRKEELLEAKKFKPFFHHEDENGNLIKFEDSDISAGSLDLYKTLPIMLDVLNRGGVFLIDELQGTLHPHIAELFIKIFNNPLVNVNNAQLIYTTHDTSLMDSEFIRREQICFCDKNNSETSIYSLDDFDKKSVTPNTAFASWYNDGRFRAVPNINYRLVNTIVSNMIAKY